MLSTYICMVLLVVVGISCYVEGNFGKRQNIGLHHVLKKLRRQLPEACPDSNMCRSQWGYCGTGSDFCGEGCTAGPCSTSVTVAPGGSGNNGGDNSACPDSNMCQSQWGYCGTGPDFCGEGCRAGPCSTSVTGAPDGSGNNGDENIISKEKFACAFNTIDAETRANRFNGLKNSGWNPVNNDEAAVFLAHAFHETDGLKTVREYCAPECGSHYAGSWCEIQGNPDKLYYGRGWFQLSWPCNYYAAGKALGVDLLNNPDLVEQEPELAVKTAIWFYTSNQMHIPARQGDFAASTRIINGALECNGGSHAANQQQRVETYKRMRQCFGLGEPTVYPAC